jgi:hypothetical protein
LYRSAVLCRNTQSVIRETFFYEGVDPSRNLADNRASKAGKERPWRDNDRN